jgi:hypothetical protein
MADLARYRVPPEAGPLVRRDPLIDAGWQFGAVERTWDNWLIAVRGYGDGSIETDDPLQLVREGPVLDLLRLNPTQPHRWRLVRGSVTVLGAIEPQYLRPAPVRLHSDPLAWLRSGGEGLCLLTPDWHEQRDILSQCRSGFAVDDLGVGRHLQDVIARPLVGPPPIFVRRAAA